MILLIIILIFLITFIICSYNVINWLKDSKKTTKEIQEEVKINKIPNSINTEIIEQKEEIPKENMIDPVYKNEFN